MKTVCDINDCTGCGACIDICPKEAINLVDSVSAYNMIIDESNCIKCNLCHKVCPNINEVTTISPIMWKQGWVDNENERMKSSSGGFATAIAKEFVKTGGIVWSCEFIRGKFVFSSAQTEKEVERFRGSKYIKSSPRGIYKKIKLQLAEEKKVLFIGLPCQIAGVKNFVGEKLYEKLYTVDLICHGTPSPILLEKYLKQDFKINLNESKSINFRQKNKYKIQEERKDLLPNRVQDRYTMAFLKGLDYTENCYNCKYAKKERISDVTIGDSWGSELPEEEQKKGISLALCQTEKGKELLEKSNLELKEVNLDRAIEHNVQLRHPSVKPIERKIFLDKYAEQMNFNNAVRASYPKICFKQDFKQILIRLKILKKE